MPSRGEGFSLTPLEALACKLPVITTRWGGHLDYLDDDNCYLIDCHLKKAPKEVQYYVFNPEAQMAEPEVKHLRQLLREVKEDYPQAQKKADRAYTQWADKLTWEAAAQQIFSLINERGWDIGV